VIGTYASAIFVSLAAILVGRAICVLSGHDGSTWLAPAVGFAALMVVCEVAIGLPGRGWTAVAAVVVLCAASVWIPARRGARWPSLRDALPVAIVVLVIVSIPFVANARVGVLGISFLNDTHWHLILAEGLRRPAIQPLDNFGPGYPLGPHAVAATFAQALGSDVDKTLTGVLIATPMLTGLAALGALIDLRRGWRWLVAVLAAIPYLAAAWYVQSAFKEPIMSLLMLGLVLTLQAGRRDRFAHPVAVVVPAAVLIAGVLYDYSYPGLLWPAAILACWLALELVVGGAWRRLRPIAAGARSYVPELVVGAGLLVVLVAPDIGRIHTFWLSNGGTSVGTVGGITGNSLANLAGPLHTLEGLNIWLIGDFRFAPTDTFQAGAFVGFALIVLVFAVVSALQRRDLAWLAAILGFSLIYVYAQHRQSPYVAAKALVIPAPLVMLGSGGALMRRLHGADWRSFATLVLAGASILFFVLSFQSVFLVLRDAQVGPNDHVSELRSLRPLLHNRPTLVLFYDEYFKWELLGVPASSPLLSSPIPASVQPDKPWSNGQPLDFDSVDAATLDLFAYVITTRTSAQSEPPSNFHFVGGSRSYEVWQRVGPTRPRLVLPESGAPGAILDCGTALGRRISRERGLARVRPAPRYFNVPPLAPGQSEQLVLSLPAGDWDLSLPFVSQQAVTVRGNGLNVRLPPNLDRPGEIWPVGRTRTTGAPVALTLTMADPAPITSSTPSTQFFGPERMIAVPVARAQTVPLHAACGRYVDWYELA
jgi:hypothetical protein